MAGRVKFSTEVKYNHICTLGRMYEYETYVIQQLQTWKRCETMRLPPTI